VPQQLFSGRVLYSVLVLIAYGLLQVVYVDVQPGFTNGTGWMMFTSSRGWPEPFHQEHDTAYFASRDQSPSEFTTNYWAAAIDAGMGVAVVMAGLLAYDIARSRQVTLRQSLWLVVLFSVACRFVLGTFGFGHPAELLSLLVIVGSVAVGYRSGRSKVVGAAGGGFSS